MNNPVKLTKNEMKMIIGGDYTAIEAGVFSCARDGSVGGRCGGTCSEGGGKGTCSDSSGTEACT
jgi:hypothetical protein